MFPFFGSRARGSAIGTSYFFGAFPLLVRRERRLDAARTGGRATINTKYLVIIEENDGGKKTKRMEMMRTAVKGAGRVCMKVAVIRCGVPERAYSAMRKRRHDCAASAVPARSTRSTIYRNVWKHTFHVKKETHLNFIICQPHCSCSYTYLLPT